MTDVKPVQPEKQDSSSEVTDDGIAMDVKPVQPEKQDSSSEVTDAAIVTDVKPVQPEYLLLVDYQYYTL